MRRALLVVHWMALLGAVAASALLAAAWIDDDVHVVSSYGFGSGPGRHSGWGVLAALLFLGLPAAGCFVLGWIATLLARAAYRDGRVVRRALWATGAIGTMAVGLLVTEEVLDWLGDRERAREQRQVVETDRIAADHDALAAFGASHDVRQPMMPGGATPLHAAVVHRFPDLVSAFLARGAVPTEGDVTSAARSGDAAVVRSLLAAPSAPPGRDAIADAFDRGDGEMLTVLVDAHADVGGALPRLLDPGKLALRPGEVEWQALRARWRASPPPPKAIASAIGLFTSQGNAEFPATERDVLSVLDTVLSSQDLCLDPALASLPLEPWMRETRLCTCNYCPYVRQIHWAILVALYPGSIPRLERSEHVAMLRVLARAVARPADREAALRAAVDGRNLYLLQLLEDERFDVRLLDGKVSAGAFLAVYEDQQMKKHLIEKGVVLRE